MRTTTNLILLLTMVLTTQAAQVFQFPVVRDRTPRRGEPGELEINESGVSYQSIHGKTTLHIPLANIWGADLSQPGRISIETVDRDKRSAGRRTTFRFRFRQAADQQTLTRFFAGRLGRPVVGQYSLSGPTSFELAAYHRHILGGTHGTIRIGARGIEFLSATSKDSRTWPYRDIETIGSPDPFHFRITSFAETYTFELTGRLPEQAYDFAWRRVYQLQDTSLPAGPREGHSVGEADVTTAQGLQRRRGSEKEWR